MPTTTKAAAETASLDELRRLVEPEAWIDDPAQIAPRLREQRGLFTGRTPVLLRPSSTAEVARIVAFCNQRRLAVVPQGGNTGLVGAGVPSQAGDEILVEMGRMDRVRDIDAANDTMTVEAGCILSKIQDVAAEHDRLFPLSLGAEGSCQIGGNLSTNAGGTAVLRYGNARDLVLGLEVVLPDGTIWDGLSRLRKDNTGYDLKHLFIGAEGTLGIITAAVLKLFPRPADSATALVALRRLDDVVTLLDRAKAASGDAVTGFEYMARIGIDLAVAHVPGTVDPFARRYDHYALVELTSSAANTHLAGQLESVLAEAMEDGGVRDAVVAQNAGQAQAMWRLREAVPEAQRAAGASIKHDVSVPVSRVPDFIATAADACRAALDGVRPVPFGHVGDGNIHFNLMQPETMDGQAFLDLWARFNRIVHDIVDDMGGSISAEHGIGRLKKDELRRYASPVKLELMRTLKNALDPNGIMNPGKVL